MPRTPVYLTRQQQYLLGIALVRFAAILEANNLPVLATRARDLRKTIKAADEVRLWMDKQA
jgi:hypothetical protein